MASTTQNMSITSIDNINQQAKDKDSRNFTTTPLDQKKGSMQQKPESPLLNQAA